MKRFLNRREQIFEARGHVEGDVRLMETVGRHLERHVGPADFVFHDTRSRPVPVDVHHVPPAEDRPFQALVTSGMARAAMAVPPGAEPYAELFLLLPPEWSLRDLWPIHLLQELARYPHEWETWIGCGHTIQNGAALDPYAGGVAFCAALLTRPVSLGMEVSELKLPGRAIHFYQIVLLYREELRFALQHGTDALLARFAQYQSSDVVDPRRRNTCRFDVH